ncbi:MAG: aldehyde dehydrogenase family protein, partial [Actinomycetota bacterium]
MASPSRSRRERIRRRRRRRGSTPTLTSGRRGFRPRDRGSREGNEAARRAASFHRGASMSEHVQLWIGGEWVDARDGATFEATSPSTGEVIGTVAEGARADAQRAIDAANRAARGWA